MTIFRQTYAQIKLFPSVFWILITAVFINQLGNAAFVFLVLYLTKHLHFSVMQATYCFAISGVSMFLTGLLGGTLIDRFGSVRMMVNILILNGITLICFPLLQHFYSVFMMCIVWGCIFGLYRPAGQTFVSLLAPLGFLKIAFTVYRLALNLGMSIGPAIAGYLALHSFPAIFRMNGLSNILAAIILFVGFKNSSWMNYTPTLEHQFEFSLKWLKRDALLRWFILGLIPTKRVFFKHETTLAVFLARDLHFSSGFYGLLFTVNTLMIVFLELPLNVAMLSWRARNSLFWGSFFITLGFLGFYFAYLKWHIILLTMCWTIGEMILFPATSTYISDLSPEGRRGSYMSIYSASSNMGIFFGPLVGGIIMEQFSSHALWLSCGLWGMMTLMIFAYMPMLPRKAV